VAQGQFWDYGLRARPGGQLWQWAPTGIQKMTFDTMSHTQDDQLRGPWAGHTQDTGTSDPLHTIVRDAIREGTRQAATLMWFLLPADNFHRLGPVREPLQITPVSIIDSTANRPMGS